MAVNPQTVERPSPTYAVAELFPPEGQWTEEEYLALDANRIVELSDGRLEVAEMPTTLHQVILGRLYLAVMAFVTQHALGLACFAPLRVRLWPGKFREPDLVFMAAAHADRLGEKYWGVPDLVAELISPGNPELDRDIKKDEYARAGIPEYWLVDLEKQTIEVYLLAAGQYQSGQTLRLGDTLASTQLPEFEVGLAELFRDE